MNLLAATECVLNLIFSFEIMNKENKLCSDPDGQNEDHYHDQNNPDNDRQSEDEYHDKNDGQNEDHHHDQNDPDDDKQNDEYHNDDTIQIEDHHRDQNDHYGRCAFRRFIELKRRTPDLIVLLGFGNPTMGSDDDHVSEVSQIQNFIVAESMSTFTKNLALKKITSLY